MRVSMFSFSTSLAAEVAEAAHECENAGWSDGTLPKRTWKMKMNMKIENGKWKIHTQHGINNRLKLERHLRHLVAQHLHRQKDVLARRALADVHLRKDLRLQARLGLGGGHEEVFLVGGEGRRHGVTGPAGAVELGGGGVYLPDDAIFFFVLKNG